MYVIYSTKLFNQSNETDTVYMHRLKLIKYTWKSSASINKHLMSGPKGNSEFCFPKTLDFASGNIEPKGKQNSLFPTGPVIKCFVIPPNSKVEKTAKKSSALCRLAHKFTAFQGAWHDHVRVQSSCCCFLSELVSFARPRGLASFDLQHVTCSPPVGKRIWVGRYMYNNHCRYTEGWVHILWRAKFITGTFCISLQHFLKI